MEILLSTASISNYGLNRIFDFAKRAGFDGIELFISDQWDYLQSDYLKDLSKKTKLKIKAVHAPFAPISLWGQHSYGPNEAYVSLEKSIALADELKVDFLVFHPSVPGDPRFYNAILTHLPELQKRTGVVIAAENLPRKVISRGILGKLTFAYEAHDIETLKKFDTITLDISHAATEADPVDFLKQLSDRIVHIHFSDVNREHDHLLPGNGILKLNQILAEIKKSAFSGMITIEISPRELKENNTAEVEKRLRLSIDYVKKAFSGK